MTLRAFTTIVWYRSNQDQANSAQERPEEQPTDHAIAINVTEPGPRDPEQDHQDIEVHPQTAGEKAGHGERP